MATMNFPGVQWALEAEPVAAIAHIAGAAKELKFKSSTPEPGTIVVKSPSSLRHNTFPGTYTGTIASTGQSTTVTWSIKGQGTNIPKNLDRLAEKLPAGVLSSTQPVTNVDDAYRQKHGIAKDAMVAAGVGGYVAFDGHFVTIQHTGVLGRLTVGKGIKRIPLASVTAVQLKPAGTLISGFIQFTLPGGIERRSEFGSQTADASNDENSMLFTTIEQPSFVALRNTIEAAIIARHSPVPSAPAPAAPAPTVLDQLAQLGSLKDAGILTAEEFEAKKAELLKRL